MSLAWLTAHLAIIRWVVMGIAIVASFWAGKHWEWLEWQASIAETQQTTINNGVIAHDTASHIIALPSPDVSKLLKVHWTR